MCTQSHDESCTKCEELKDTMHSIRSWLDSLNMTENELDDQKYTYHLALQQILAWKSHQLRSVRQDAARTSVLEGLDDSSVLITQDWAMKFLPLKYRETQFDWFGKRGISWHISLVARKKQGKLQTQAFVHIVENCNQDGYVVVLIIKHVLRTLKNEHPELSNAYLRQDNAACYHSTVMLETCSYMAGKTGIAVVRVDFSDAQDGKGACDRKAATIKAHVGRYVNEGHDVKTASQFKEAMLSGGVVHGVRVAVVDAGVGSKTELAPLIKSLCGAHTTLGKGK